MPCIVLGAGDTELNVWYVREKQRCLPSWSLHSSNAKLDWIYRDQSVSQQIFTESLLCARHLEFHNEPKRYNPHAHGAYYLAD